MAYLRTFFIIFVVIPIIVNIGVMVTAWVLTTTFRTINFLISVPGKIVARLRRSKTEQKPTGDYPEIKPGVFEHPVA